MIFSAKSRMGPGSINSVTLTVHIIYSKIKSLFELPNSFDKLQHKNTLSDQKHKNTCMMQCDAIQYNSHVMSTTTIVICLLRQLL